MEAVVYGKAGCPYTQAARDDLRRRGIPHVYHDVLQNPAALQEMLAYSGGVRKVPVVVREGNVSIGFNGF